MSITNPAPALCPAAMPAATPPPAPALLAAVAVAAAAPTGTPKKHTGKKPRYPQIPANVGNANVRALLAHGIHPARRIEPCRAAATSVLTLTRPASSPATARSRR